MPIKVQSDLPAKAILEEENIFIMDERRAMTQDIRPLEILILNLMPMKEETETQLLRALSNTPLQVDCTFLMMASHVSKNTSASHLNKFYVEFNDIKRRKYDGMIDQWRSVMFLYDSALKKVNTKIEILNNEFVNRYDYNPIEHIKSRLKTADSIVKKLKKDGHDVTIENMMEHLSDIAGIDRGEHLAAGGRKHSLTKHGQADGYACLGD